jgi:hypothetical protein
MAGNLFVYGLLAVMLGVIVRWAFDAWTEAKRRRLPPKHAIDKSDRSAPAGTGIQQP